MSLQELLPELYKLTPEEMAQAIEILQKHMTELNPTNPHIDATYEIWSPQITPETARQLLDMLEKDAAKHT